MWVKDCNGMLINSDFIVNIFIRAKGSKYQVVAMYGDEMSYVLCTKASLTEARKELGVFHTATMQDDWGFQFKDG